MQGPGKKISHRVCLHLGAGGFDAWMEFRNKVNLLPPLVTALMFIIPLHSDPNRMTLRSTQYGVSCLHVDMYHLR